MNTAWIDPALSAAFWIIVKASAVLGLAAIAQTVLPRRHSAATRHLVWIVAITAVLLLPVLSFMLPDWPVVIRTAPGPVVAATTVTERAEARTSLERQPASVIAETTTPPAAFVDGIRAAARPNIFPWRIAIPVAYAAGVLILLIYGLGQRSRIHRFARRATEVGDRRWTTLLQDCAAEMGVRQPVRLLRSRECNMPMAFGTLRPAVVIPTIADTWPEDRRRAVVLHELAHVARRDCLAQSIAFAACALYWFHPAVWLVARRLRIERELACDDRVIAAGAPACEYAGHLLEIAFSLGSDRAPALAVTMARPRQLEGRLLAALDAARNRRVPAFRVYAAGVLIAAAVVLPLASATSTVIAVEVDHDRRPAAAAPAAEAVQAHVTAASLNAVEWPFVQSARRFLYRVASAVGVSQDKLPGTWEIRPANADGTVHLRLVELNSSSGSNLAIEQLEGLTAAQLTGAGGPVQFRLRRDAGTFAFEGVIRSGIGAGTFSFVPDAKFPAELAKRGLARPSALEQYKLARNDTGYAFIDELSTQRYAKPQTSDLVRAGDHGVNLAYLRGMSALGYRLGTLEPLIQLRDHGVTPDYVRELANQGYKGLPADELRRARDHGVTPDYVQAMRDNGHGSLTLEQLIRARDHGVDAAYAGGMRQLGYAVAIEALITARDHGVDVEYTRQMTSLAYSGQPLESLIRMRDHGVDPKYVSELEALGYDGLSVDDLVTLRDRGLTAEQIRAANARAKTRLPVDLLKQLAR